MKIGKESMYYDPEAPYDAIAIANYFIDCAKGDGCEDLSPMKVQKLVYFAHGWYAGIVGEPLIQDPVEAWSYGPVIASIYREFKHYGNKKILQHAESNREYGTPHQLKDWKLRKDAKVIYFLQDIWKKYKKYSAVELANMTHLPTTPWYEVAYKKYGRNIPFATEIYFRAIKEHFRDKFFAAAQEQLNIRLV